VKKAVLLLLFLAGCAPDSRADFRHEGESICRDLAKELHKIETPQQLNLAAPKLKSCFNRLADVMIAARKFEGEEEESFDPGPKDKSASDALVAELKRIYRLEGGREAIEKIQKEALLKIDSFESKRK